MILNKFTSSYEPRFERHIRIDKTVDSAVETLANATDLSRTCIKQVMQQGAVWLTRNRHTQRLRRASRGLQAGDELHLYYDEKVLSQQPSPARLITDEGAYSVWFKPSGMLSQGSKWGDHCTIARWVELRLQRSVFLVHRLDRAASGLILIAHGKRPASQLAGLFRRREVEKQYRVVVQGKFPSKPNPYRIETELDGRQAVSSVQRLEFAPAANESLLEVTIETGRKHQIRRHLADLGFPLVGDRLYGRREEQRDLQLCAIRLGFICPITHQKRIYQAPEECLPKLN